MNIDAVKNGIVLDHIPAGRSMEIYKALELEKLDCQVAIIRNAQSEKMGKKDILKIDADVDLDFTVLGYLAPGITVNMIRNGLRAEKRCLELPAEVRGVIRCRNPRCITSVEQELEQVFRLTDRENRVYRCWYCDSAAHDSGI